MSAPNTKQDFSNLEQHKIEDIHGEDAMPLQQIAKPGRAWSFLIGLVLFGILVIILFLVPVPRTVKLAVTVISTGDDVLLQYASPVRVKAYSVKTGQDVQAGDTLFSLSSDFISSLASDYEKAASNLRNFEKFTIPRMKAEVGSLQKRIVEQQILQKKIEAEINEIEYFQRVAVRTLDSAVSVSEKQYQRVRKLKDQEAATELDLEISADQLLRARADRNSIESEYIFQKTGLLNQLWQTEQIIAELKEQIEIKELQMAEKGQSYRQELKSLAKKTQSYFGDGSFIEDGTVKITASKPGKISFLSLKGEIHDQNEVIARISALESSHLMAAKFSQTDYSYLKEGMQAKIKLYSFPHFKYGKIEGVVQSISSQPDLQGFYRVSIVPGDTSDFKGNIEIGHEGEATVLSKKQSIARYMLDGILNIVG